MNKYTHKKIRIYCDHCGKECQIDKKVVSFYHLTGKPMDIEYTITCPSYRSCGVFFPNEHYYAQVITKYPLKKEYIWELKK